MRSIISFTFAAFLVAAVTASAHAGDSDDMKPRYEDCSPAQNGSCSNCGNDYLPCGPNTCYNPKAGETCCSSTYACPSGFNCSSTGFKCTPKDGYRWGSSCGYGDNDHDEHDNNSSESTVSATTTITSTTTNTITVSATTTSCALPSSTTGLAFTNSVASYGNTTTVALTTTTSTLSVANATHTLPTSNITLNATKPPSPTVSPPISGYKGTAAGLQGQASASLFALGSLILMSSLLL